MYLYKTPYYMCDYMDISYVKHVYYIQ